MNEHTDKIIKLANGTFNIFANLKGIVDSINEADEESLNAWLQVGLFNQA